MRRLIAWVALLWSAAGLAAPVPDGDMEQPDRGPWTIYGTPVTVEKSDHAHSGARSLRVVTDNKETMGGNFEGTSYHLGEHRAGDLLRISFWYDVRGSKSLTVGIGPTYFMGHWWLTGTDWTRADLTFRCPKTSSYTIWLSQSNDATEFYLDDFEVEVVQRPDLGVAPVGERLALSGGPLRLTLCRTSGALCGVENLATGEVYSEVGRRRPLLGLEVLAPGGAGLQPVAFQALRLVRLDEDPPGEAELEWRAEDLDLRVRLRLRLTGDGGAHFLPVVENRSDRRVMSVELPVVSGLCPAADPEKLTLVDPHVCGRIVPNPLKSDGCQTTYPGRGVMGWMDLSGERGGVYLASHDRAMTGTRLMALPTPDPGFDLSLAREIVVKPGESWEGPESVLAVHEGDWHASADRYREWARSWMRRPDVPAWLHEANGWVLMGVQNGIPFRHIPDVFRSALWMGIDYLHVQGEGTDNMWRDADGKWHHHAMTYPYPSPKFGTPQELREAVSRIHEAGGHVMFYFLYERWTPSLSTSDDFGSGTRAEVPAAYQPPGLDFYYDNGLLDRPGSALPGEHPFMAERLMCLGAPGWQEWMRRWAVDVYAGEYGADGFYWDVMGRNGPFRCYNSRHGHEGHNEWAAGSARVLETTIRQGRELNPDYSCAIEGCSDVLGQWVGYHLMSGATLQPNVFRYTFPEYLCVDGFSNHTFKLTHPQKAHRVFLDGERFDIHGYDQRVKKIINLRRRIKAFTDWPAVFKDTVGLSVSDPRVQARAFWRTDAENRVIAVTLMNEEGVEGAQVTVDLTPIGPARSVHLFHLDGSVEEVAELGGREQVIPVPAEPISAAVIANAVGPNLAVVPWLEQIMRPGADGVALCLFTPLERPADIRFDMQLPAGGALQAAPGECDHVRRREWVDPGRLGNLTRWARATAKVSWGDGEAQSWCLVAPPLVNGDFEEVEDGRLVHWGTPPCEEDPAQGRYCIRLDRETAPAKLISSLTPVKPGCKYRFKCRVKRSPAATSWAGAHVVEYLEGSQFERSAALNSGKLGVWETLETTFTTHPDPRSTAIYLYNFDEAEPAWFDALELEEAGG